MILRELHTTHSSKELHKEHKMNQKLSPELLAKENSVELPETNYNWQLQGKLLGDPRISFAAASGTTIATGVVEQAGDGTDTD